MSKTWKAILIFTATIIFVGIGWIAYKSINSIYLLPQPSLGRGIYKIVGIDPGKGLIWSPNGKYLAGLIVGDPPMPDFPCLGCDPHSEIFILDLEKMKRRTVISSDKFDKFGHTISWFLDSEHIAYNGEGAGSKQVIRSIHIDGTIDVQFMAETRIPSWHPDKPLLVLADERRESDEWYATIHLVDLSTMKKELIFQGEYPNALIWSLSWSADGKTLAFSYGAAGQQETQKPNIFLWDLETRKLTQFTNDKFEYIAADFSPLNNIIALQQWRDTSGVTILKDLTNNCEIELPILSTVSASWSPDGNKLVISTEGDAYIVDLTEYAGSTDSICSLP